MRAGDVLTKAAELVSGDRDRQHGQKRDNFHRIAVMWNAWLSIRRDPLAPLSPSDVGEMMSLMKKARKQSGAFNIDDYIDDAGYTGCSAEIESELGHKR